MFTLFQDAESIWDDPEYAETLEVQKFLDKVGHMDELTIEERNILMIAIAYQYYISCYHTVKNSKNDEYYDSIGNFSADDCARLSCNKYFGGDAIADTINSVKENSGLRTRVEREVITSFLSHGILPLMDNTDDLRLQYLACDRSDTHGAKTISSKLKNVEIL